MCTKKILFTKQIKAVLRRSLKKFTKWYRLSCYIFKQTYCLISVIKYKPILSQLWEKAIMGNHFNFPSNPDLPSNTNVLEVG